MYIGWAGWEGGDPAFSRAPAHPVIWAPADSLSELVSSAILLLSSWGGGSLRSCSIPAPVFLSAMLALHASPRPLAVQQCRPAGPSPAPAVSGEAHGRRTSCVLPHLVDAVRGTRAVRLIHRPQPSPASRLPPLRGAGIPSCSGPASSVCSPSSTPWQQRSQRQRHPWLLAARQRRRLLAVPAPPAAAAAAAGNAPNSSAPRGPVVVVDNYDSFTYNLCQVS